MRQKAGTPKPSAEKVIKDIPRRSFTLTEWGAASEVGSLKLLFQKGDILFGKIRPYFHKVAYTAISGVASSDAIVIRPKSEQFVPLALCVAFSDAFVAHAVQTSNGTKMPRAQWNVLRDYPVAIAPMSLLSRFASAVRPSLELAGKLSFQNRNLRTQRDLLLPKLISGAIDVSAAEQFIRDAAA